MLSAPTSTAPAACMRCTSMASAVAAGSPLRTLLPARVVMPSMSNRFFTAYGMPASEGSTSPRARLASMARASRVARSKVPSVKALTRGSVTSMRAMQCSSASSASISPE
jgi:hypothetical protein